MTLPGSSARDLVMPYMAAAGGAADDEDEDAAEDAVEYVDAA